MLKSIYLVVLESAAVSFGPLIVLVAVLSIAFYGAGYHKVFFGRSIDKKLKKFHLKYPDLVESGLILIRDLPFFDALDESGKKLLIKNATEIIKRIKMVNEQNRLLDLERSFQVSLVLAMAAMGLERDSYYYGLKKIKIYEEQFYSKIVGAEVRGLSYATGYLSLSWKDFMYGFTTMEDRYNVGLHEAAHLLVICGYVSINDGADPWFLTSSSFMSDVRQNEDMDKGIFRPYAFTNLHEFWACCVEQFFELPNEFKTHHPHIYQHTKAKLGH